MSASANHIDELLRGALTKGWSPDAFTFAGPGSLEADLTSDERRLVVRTVAAFRAGERVVSDVLYFLLDALPAVQLEAVRPIVIAQLFEEERHDRFFRRAAIELGLDIASVDLREGLHADEQNLVELLRDRMVALATDRSPVAVARAVSAYHLVGEGVAGMTLVRILDEVGKRPSCAPFLEAAHYLRTDEARHVATGVIIVNDLIARYGQPVLAAAEAELRSVSRVARKAVVFPFMPDPFEPRFGLTAGQLVNTAGEHLRSRTAALAKAA